MKRNYTQAQLDQIPLRRTAALKKRRLMRTGYGPQAIVPYRARAQLVPIRYGGWTGRGLRVEKKYVDTPINVSGLNSLTGALGLINGIAQGDGADQRDGRQVTIRSIQIRGYFATDLTNNAGKGAAGMVRMVVVLDKQSNSAAPTISDVFVGFDSSTLTNLNNRMRFKILADETMSMGGFSTYVVSGVTTYAGSGGFPTPVINFYKKCNITVQFNGTTNAIGSIASNSIYVFFLVSNVDKVQFSGNARVRFTDA